jgi:polysaccharide biosynthesis/export protein
MGALLAGAMLWLIAGLSVGAAVAGTVEPGIDSAASPVERAFSARAGEPLRLFGYELFASVPASAVRRVPQGAVPGDYLLGVGDVLTVTLRGRVNASRRAAVDAEGLLIVDEVPPVPAAGRSFAEFRAALTAAATAAHPDTEVYVSLSEVRQIGVVAVGAVRRPGRADLPGHATVYDALAAAGGVTRDGSLRRIALTRGAETRTIDLYDLLLTGQGGAERLRDGDRIVVPPLGPTTAVAGPVKRPGIYELPPGRQRVSLTELRDLAGGLIRPSAAAAVRLGLAADGTETAGDVSDPDASFGDGDLLLLAPQREDRRRTVRIEGHVHRPGARPLASASTVGAALSETDLKPGAYRPMALVSGSSSSGTRVLRGVDLGAALAGRDDAPLADGDEVIVLGEADIAFLTAEPVLARLRGEVRRPESGCRGLTLLSRALAADPDGPLARGPQAVAARRLAGPRDPCPPVFDRWPEALAFLLSQSALVANTGARSGFYPRLGGGGTVADDTGPRVELTGAVRHPGVRPLARAATLRALLDNGAEIAASTYPLFGLIERVDRGKGGGFIPFVPRDVAIGKADRALADGDRVRLFAGEDIRRLPAGGEPAPAGNGAVPMKAIPPSLPPLPPLPEDPPSGEIAELIAGESRADDPELAGLLRPYAVSVRGAVRRPGLYPLADTATVEAVLGVAGGLAPDAGTSAEIAFARGGEQRRTLDLTRPSDRRAVLGAGDALRVDAADGRLEAGTVSVAGEVRRPGTYDVLRGERLSSLIARAGGLTEDAYPAGAVFTRASEKARQKDDFETQARAIERTLATATAKPEETAFLRQLVTQLRGAEASGRVVVEADPAALKAHPEADMPLEAGDRLTVPKRAPTVTVAGEVLAPGAQRFTSGTSADAYIERAGGLTARADAGRAFVVLPEGRAEPLAISSWNHAVRTVPPGATIVVPFDSRPYGFVDFSKDLGGIISQLAITAASISVIGR